MYPRDFRLNKNVKNCIAVLLKYYRKQLKMKQKDFITYNNALICSMDSYSRIENLHPIKSDSIYIYLLHQIGATIEYDPAFWANLQPLFEQLLHDVTFYHIHNLQKTALKIKKLLPTDSSDIFVKEILDLCDLIPNYYAKCSDMSEEQFDKYMALLDIFTKPLKEIIKDMLFTYTVHRTRNAKKEQEIFEFLKINESDTPLNILNRSYMHFYRGWYLDCFRDSLELERIFIETENYNRLLDVYDVMALLYVELQKNQNNIYQQKLFKLVREHKDQLHKNKYLQSLYQCGMLYLEDKEYEQAYPFFVELADQDDYHYLPAALIANTICTLLDTKPDPAILKEVRYPERFPQHVTQFHEYYRMKYSDVAAEKLEDFLVMKIAPTLAREDLYWEPFQMELENVLKITKHYYVKRKLKIK